MNLLIVLYSLLCSLVIMHCDAAMQEDFETCIQQVMGVHCAVPQSYCAAKNNFVCKTKLITDKNILILEGETGCGKTTLAKIFAEDTNSVCIKVSCGELLSSGLMGGAADEVAKVFERANRHINRVGQKVVIIFEDIDSFAKQGQQSVHDNEAEKAYKMFNNQADENRKNASLMIIGTTNYYDRFPAEFKDRCTRITVKAPAKHEYVMIIKNLLLGNSAKRLAIIGGDLFKTYKNPGEIIHRNLNILTKLTHDVTPSQQNSAHRVAKDSCAEKQARLLAIRELIKRLESLPADVEAKNSEYVQWGLEHLKRWLHDILSIDQEIVAQLVARAQQANWDGHLVTEETENMIRDILVRVDHLQQSPYSPDFFEGLKAIILDFKTQISQFPDASLRKSYNNFLKRLNVFVKVYALVHDEAKMAVLYRGEYPSIRVVEEMVSSIESALAKAKDLNIAELTALRDDAISQNKQKKCCLIG